MKKAIFQMLEMTVFLLNLYLYNLHALCNNLLIIVPVASENNQHSFT